MISDKKYNIIYADPPWRYKLWKVDLNMPYSKRHVRMASAFYNTMSTEEICNLSTMIKEIADPKKCALFLWVTNPCLTDGLKVMEAWGFNYITVAFVWLKINPNSSKEKLGLGYYTRPNTELCLLGKMGNGLRVKDRSVYQVQKSEVREHSRKPDRIRNEIVKLFGDLPRIELFARHKTYGWDSWGDQLDGDQHDIDSFLSPTSEAQT